MKNKPGTHFRQKVTIDEIEFDSKREATFYQNFVKGKVARFTYHPKFTIDEQFPIGGRVMKAKTYVPDFLIYDEEGDWAHVIDIKTGFNFKAIDSGTRDKFRLFAKFYHFPVEIVVPSTKTFRMKILGLVGGFDDIRMSSLNYQVRDLIGN